MNTHKSETSFINLYGHSPEKCITGFKLDLIYQEFFKREGADYQCIISNLSDEKLLELMYKLSDTYRKA